MSNKVLLDMDMPNYCAECPLFEDRYDYPTCYVTKKSEGYNFKIHEKRMPNCPLTGVKIGENPFPEIPNRNHKVYNLNP